jgi:hypothetical protein
MGDTWTDGHGTVLYGTCGHGHRQKDEVNCTVLYCTVLVWMLAMMLLPAAEGLDLDLYANQQSAAGARAGG